MNIHKTCLLIIIALISVIFLNNINAAILPILGIDAGQIQPGNVQRDKITKPPVPLSVDKKLHIPSLSQDLDLGDAKKYTFKLKKVKFTGNDIFSSEELEQTYQPFYGHKITVAKLLELINKTTLIYREADYVLSQAYLPAQDIDKEKGVITIGIVEGYINDVSVVSDSMLYSTKLLLIQYGKHLKAERPLTKATLERYALLAQDLPGGNIKAVFSPAANAPGAANVEFVVNNNVIVAVDGTVDNRGTRLLGPTEFSGTVNQYGALYGNNTYLNGIRDDKNEFVIYNFSHRQPVNADGLAFTLQLAKTNTDPNFSALPNEIRINIHTPGVNKSISGKLEYPFIRSREYNLVGSVKLEANNNRTAFLHQTLFHERIRVLRAGLTLDFLDPDFLFPDFLAAKGVTLIRAEFSQGLKGLSAFLRDDVATRPNTKKDFQKITGVLSRTQPIVDNLVLRLLLNGQYAYDALLSSEEFGFGGRSMGLAYDAYAISGDHGIAGKAELAFNVPFNSLIDSVGVGRSINDVLVLNLELFGYYDSGKVWNIHHVTSGQRANDSATSNGGGVRGSVLKYLVYEAYIAKPINRIVDNEQNKKRRAFYSVGFNYPF